VFLLVLLLFSNLVSAQAVYDIDITDSFQMAGEVVVRALTNDYVAFLIVLIIGSIMLKGVYYAGLTSIPKIESSGHVNSISWSLSILTIVGAIWTQRAVGVQGILESLGIFKFILFSILLIFVYQGIKKTIGGA